MKKMITLFKKTLLLCIILPLGMLNAQDKVYLSTSGDDVKDGLSAENAVRTFAKAIELTTASAGVVTEIIIAPGVYTELAEANLNAACPNLLIKGESAKTTIIEITGTGRIINTSADYLTTTNNLTIRDLTLRNGNTGAGNPGGAIYFGRNAGSNNNLTLERVVFDNNQATTSNGGALFFNGNELTVTDCYFKNNKVLGTTQQRGGAITLVTVNNTNGLFATFINTTFDGNEAAHEGGAIFLNNPGTVSPLPANNPTIKFFNCTFVGNKSLGTGVGGALLFSNTTTAETFLLDYYIVNCTFLNNSSSGVSARNTISVNGNRYSNAHFVNNLIIPLESSSTGNTINANNVTGEKWKGQNNLIGGTITVNLNINSSYFRADSVANNNLAAWRADFNINSALTDNSTETTYAVPYLALNAGSAAINFGTNTYGDPNIVPANDVRGVAAFGSSKEIGAYEYRNVPGAPTSVVATPGNTQASVAFTVPEDNGGAAILDYTVTSSPGGFTATGSSSPIVVTGLSNGTEYTFTVTARNDAGDSEASLASEGVTPDISTGNQTQVNLSVTIININEGIKISGLNKNDLLQVYSSNGSLLYHVAGNQSEALIPVSKPGIYIVSINGKAQKHIYR